MSLKAMLWVLEDCTVAEPELRVLLFALADRAANDGTSAFPSRAWLAERCFCSVRSVSRRLARLEEMGIIRRGDQHLVDHFRADRRPVVWDLNITYGVTPVTRRDTGDRSATSCRGDTCDTYGVTPVTERGDTAVSYKPSYKPSIEPSNSVGFSLAKTDAPKIDRFEPPRKDVEQLCSTLQAMMVERGCRKPSITRKWRDAARLLLDRDKIPLNEALIVLAWSQKDEFWQGNIMSMPTFRKQYDKLKVQAKKGLDTVPEVRAAIYAAAAEEFEADMAARDRRALR